MTKLIIAGSRNFQDYTLLCNVLDKLPYTITEIVSGTCRGADLLGERYALEHNIPIKRFPANWDLYGKSAGPIRNKQMAIYADKAVVFYYPDSRGSLNMINNMHRYNKEVLEVLITS